MRIFFEKVMIENFLNIFCTIGRSFFEKRCESLKIVLGYEFLVRVSLTQCVSRRSHKENENIIVNKHNGLKMVIALWNKKNPVNLHCYEKSFALVLVEKKKNDRHKWLVWLTVSFAVSMASSPSTHINDTLILSGLKVVHVILHNDSYTWSTFCRRSRNERDDKKDEEKFVHVLPFSLGKKTLWQ